MARRNSDIKRGGELKYAQDNIHAYETNMQARQTRRVKGGTGTRRRTVIVGVLPFSSTFTGSITALEGFSVKMLQTTYENSDANTAFAKAKADNYYFAPTDETFKEQDKPTGFAPARLITFTPTGTGNQINYVQAKASKLYYPKRDGVRLIYPIGRVKTTPASSDERQTKQSIKTELKALLKDGKTLNFSDEKMGGNR